MQAIDPSLMVLGLLLLAAIIAGFLDTLVGGGGLITLPALLFAGVPPIFALGTNKLQSVMGTGTASLMMLRHRRVNLGQIKWLMLLAFVGSIVGSVIVQFFDSQVLSVIIPIVITMIAVYFVIVPSASLTATEPKVSQSTYASTAVPSIGFYDGMFGPGTGSFFVLAGVSLRGQEIVSATANAKVLNFATNFASLLVFVFYSKVLWAIGAVMMVGQMLGATLGARTLLSINPSVLRYLVIAMCFIMLAAWLWKAIQ